MSVEQIRKRRKNQYDILRGLHFEGRLRRSELSRRYGIRKSSVTNIVVELIKNGVIAEDEPTDTRSRLYLESKKFHVVAAAIKPREILFGRVFMDGRMEHTGVQSFKPSSSSRQILDIVADRFQRDIAGREEEILGLGVAVRGLVDPREGRCQFAANLPNWKDVPVRSVLQERLGYPVLVDNDARCQLWANAWFERLLKTHSDVFYLSITDGVAGAYIAHGKMVLGARFCAGEIGHTRVGNERRACQCGGTDCLETYCSLPAIIDEIQRARPALNLETAADVARAATSDTAVEQIIDRAIERFSRVLSGVWSALDPELLVIGSHDRSFSRLLCPLFVKHLKNQGCRTINAAQIITADSEDETLLQGIAAYVIEDSFQRSTPAMPRLGTLEEPPVLVEKAPRRRKKALV
ncbi:MAG TPA: ROK family protein [Planctomycetota bacterium]|nr:ROK family protein [Planctomycetota bacterium]